MGRRFDNLYVLSTNFPYNSFHNVNSVVSFDIWHTRLGHVGPKKLKFLSSVLSLKTIVNKVCDVCPLAKQKHNLYHPSLSHSSTIFYLIHYDVWGPFSPVSVDGYKYFLTIVDDCSRFVLTYLLVSKGEVGKVLTQFFTQIHTQFNKSIKTIRCDNGSEFSHPKLFAKYGTAVQHSCVEPPQQNSIV